MAYVFRRLLGAVSTLFLVLLATFIVGRSIPGGPFDSEKAQPPHVRKWQEEKYGFNQPLIVHFTRYLANVVEHFDLGVSLKFTDRSVNAILGESLPVSFTIGTIALSLALVLGLIIGVLAAEFPRSIWDPIAVFFTVAGSTFPAFLMGAILVYLFSRTWEILPPARLDGPEYYILPVVTLALRPMAMVINLIRTTLQEEVRNDYTRTARAKGASETRIIVVHALRNCLLPLVTLLGPLAANILTGSFIVEHFYAIPGVAKHFIDAVLNRDVFLMMGVTLAFGALLITTNLLVDLAYPFLDPRMKNR